MLAIIHDAAVEKTEVNLYTLRSVSGRVKQAYLLEVGGSTWTLWLLFQTSLHS